MPPKKKAAGAQHPSPPARPLPDDASLNGAVNVARARFQSPDHLFDPDELRDQAGRVDRRLHTRLQARGDSLDVAGVFTCLSSTIADENEEIGPRLAALQLVERCPELIHGLADVAGLEPQAKDGLFEVLRASLRDADARIRRAVLNALAVFEQDRPAHLVRTVAEQLAREPDRGNLVAALDILRRSTDSLILLVVPQLRAFAQACIDEDAALSACHLLLRIGEELPTANIDALIRIALQSNSTPVRHDAMGIVAKIKPDVGELAELIEKYGTHQDAHNLLAEIGEQGGELLRQLTHRQPAGASTASCSVSAKRLAGTYKRDHLWLKWQERDGLTQAQIRRKWNTMTDTELREMGLEKDKGSVKPATVKEALKKAKLEPKPNDAD